MEKFIQELVNDYNADKITWHDIQIIQTGINQMLKGVR